MEMRSETMLRIAICDDIPDHMEKIKSGVRQYFANTQKKRSIFLHTITH